MRACWRGVCTQDRARARERARAARRAGHGGGAATASALLGHEGVLAVASLLAVKGQRRLLLVRLLLLLDDRARPRAPRPRSGRGSGRAAVLGLVVGVGALLAELALPLGKLLHRHRAPAHRDPRSLLLALVLHSVHATTHEPRAACRQVLGIGWACRGRDWARRRCCAAVSRVRSRARAPGASACLLRSAAPPVKRRVLSRALLGLHAVSERARDRQEQCDGGGRTVPKLYGPGVEAAHVRPRQQPHRGWHPRVSPGGQRGPSIQATRPRTSTRMRSYAFHAPAHARAHTLSHTHACTHARTHTHAHRLVAYQGCRIIGVLSNLEREKYGDELRERLARHGALQTITAAMGAHMVSLCVCVCVCVSVCVCTYAITLIIVTIC